MSIWDDALAACMEVEDDTIVLTPPTSSSSLEMEVWVPPQAEIALQDYLGMGSSRSVAGLVQRYLKHKHSDPLAVVPTTSLSVLAQWEAQYNWKMMAWEHDAEGNRAWQENRKTILSGFYSVQRAAGHRVLTMAEKAMIKHQEAADKSDTPSMSPKDALEYMKAGLGQIKEADTGIIALDDPNADTGELKDNFFDKFRQFALMNMGTMNINVGGK